jgi:hypothetical protein
VGLQVAFLTTPSSFQHRIRLFVALDLPLGVHGDHATDHFYRVARQGHEVSDATLTTHAGKRFARPVAWNYSDSSKPLSQQFPTGY